MRRREFLGALAAPAFPQAKPRKKIAALSTTYHVRSHSDNFITRFLEGYWINEKYYPPPCDIVSLYVEQTHAADISRRLSMAYGLPIVGSIREALTLGTGKLAVDGVLLIAEHGNYPNNEKNQKLYPRHEFFRQVVDVFRASGRSAPVFVDKHLSYDWEKARWMYDQSRELGFPLMAGSSVSVTFRRPELDFALGTEFEEGLAVAGGWAEDGGLFHIVETLQCFVERRRGGETGIRAVELLQGDAVWKAADRGRWSRELLSAAAARGRKVTPGRPEDLVKRPVACLLEYNDGFKAAALALGGMAAEYLAAFRVKGRAEIASTLCYIPTENSNNFSPLVDSIARCFLTGGRDYPVERTLLTTGAVAFLMESGYRGGKRVETPMLDIAYQAPEQSYFARGEGS
ncbi:MAG: hypothetical protein KIT09_10990 [Bryobacteraceae bacterium]|nr:hypothetical protein [Bryobacteraceae bacterium]